eukprot:12932110-Prorocentrum_lima.AAC.1
MSRELSSSPPAMAACKVADVCAFVHGHGLHQADATQATQSKLGGRPTWAGLPRDRWPGAWVSRKFRDPVCCP